MKQFTHQLICTWLCLVAFCTNAQTPYGNNPAAGKTIQLNGVKHYYETYGSGAPMLLIHGNSTATAGWAAQIDYFSKHYKVYSIDCRGRGKSEQGKDTLTYIQQAKDMAAFIREMQLDSVNVIGKSDGAIIALLMGIYYPEHIRRIVSFSANVVPDTTALYTATLQDIHRERVHAEEMLAKKDTSKNWELIRQLNRMMEYQPHLTAADLHRIQIPVLVISGDRDVIREAHTLFIYQSIPNANLCILPNKRHGLPKQDPQLFNSTVYEYLNTPYKTEAYRFVK